MSRTKEYFHDEIQDQLRTELMEEPQNLPANEYNFVFSVSASTITEIHSLLALAYQEIKAGYLEGGITTANKQGHTISYGYRKL